MILKDREKSKVNSSEVKYLEKELDKYEIEKRLLINEFDLNAEKILGKDVIDYLVKEKELFPKITKRVVREGRISKEAPYSNILTSVHKSKIKDKDIKEKYEKRVTEFLTKKTNELRELIRNTSIIEENKYRAKAFALASIAVNQFHNRPDMNLREVQIMSSIVVTNGDIAELGTGEGKTLGIVPSAFFKSLKGRGVHVITANSYLSNRDYEELLPVYESLGITVGFVPEGIDDLAKIENLDLNNITYEKKFELETRLKEMKKKAYQSDITYGSKSAVAFDYLRDGIARNKDDYLEREYNPSFAIIDEVDDALIDDAFCPYILGSALTTYRDNMTYLELAASINVPVEELITKMGKKVIDANTKVSYDDAREILKKYYGRELVLNQNTYQKRCQRFFKTKIQNNMYEIKDDNEFNLTKDDLYELLTDDNKEVYVKDDKELEKKIRDRIKKIKETSYVIYYKDANKYEITNACYEEFLKYCYFAFQLNGMVALNKEEILNDKSYENGKDYNLVDNVLLMTNNGAERLIKDYNHPQFVDDFRKHINNIVPFSMELTHYLNKAVSANLVMTEGKDYIIKDGRLYVLKEGRVQPDSSYTAGMQRALELKEGIDAKNQRQEIESSLSITQKEFYERYDSFAGLTGTSNKKIFREIFGKNTVEIPKNAFYQSYSNRLRRLGKQSTKEPEKVIRKDTRFTATTNDKIKLIVESVKKSLENDPPAPVLIALSNPEEMYMLSNALLNEQISNTCLNAQTDKAKEAEIISKAGLPGAVTITTEMAGRGTDIKLGGDRETIISLALAKQIKNYEEKIGRQVNLSQKIKEEMRQSLDNALVNYKNPNGKKLLWTKTEEQEMREKLSKIGLKVITSGYFNVERVDRQLEGRCGRDGVKGVIERYASLADLEHFGLSYIEYGKSLPDYFKKFPRRIDGSYDIDKNSQELINEKISITQSNNEEQIKERIINSQEISRYQTSVVSTLRKERKDIIFDRIDMDSSITKLYEDAIDELFITYLNTDNVNKDNLLDVLEVNKSLALEYFKVEVKEVLGIELDIRDIKKNNISLLELRQGLLDYLHKRREEDKEKDYDGLYEKEKMALLNANSYIISNVNNAYESSIRERNLSSISYNDMSLQLKSLNIFNEELEKLKSEASKMVVRNIRGIPLNKYEKEVLKEYTDKKNGIRVAKDEEKEARITKSRKDFISKLEKARKKLEPKKVYNIKIDKERLDVLKEQRDNLSDERTR